MGSGVDAQEALAAPLGRWLANQGFHLLTGGGGGVMAAVGRAFAEVADRDGLLVGVLPSQAGDPECSPPAGYPNRWVELVIRTHLPARGPHGASDYSRNHINVLTSDVVIGLPGGAGTASELALAVRYGRPCVAFLGDPAQMPNLPREVPRVTALNELAGVPCRRRSENARRRPGRRYPGLRNVQTAIGVPLKGWRQAGERPPIDPAVRRWGSGVPRAGTLEGWLRLRPR